MEDRGVDGVRNDRWVAELQPELSVLLERELRLQDRRVRELRVDPHDPLVGAVVEAAVDADRAVDAVHHPRPPAGEPMEPLEVEVERVEQARRRFVRDALPLDGEAAAFELAHERAQELVPAARGRRREFVEERQIGPPLARTEHVELRRETTRRSAPPAARDSARRAQPGCRRSAAHPGRLFQTCTPGCSCSTSS